MMETRLSRLYTYMEEVKLDAILITSPRHVYYLTGFLSEPHERLLSLIVPAVGEPVLLVPALDREAAEQASSVKRIATHTDTDDAYAVLAGLLPKPCRRLGLEKNHLTVMRYEAIASVAGAESFLDIEKPLREMRMIKSPEEIVRVRRAIEAVETVLAEGLKRVKPGVTEVEIVAELEYQMRKLGTQGPSFDTMVLAGEKSALPHGVPGQRKIQPGELLLFDLGVVLDGYVSDITRTFAVGDINAQLREIYDTVLAANLAAIAAVKPGATLASLDHAARHLITERGYGEYFMHRLGHGLGMEVHEYPSVHGANQDVLQPGMVFTIEPGVYVPGVGGVRIEDDVLVTESGCDVLTRFPKELTVIGV